MLCYSYGELDSIEISVGVFSDTGEISNDDVIFTFELNIDLYETIQSTHLM